MSLYGDIIKNLVTLAESSNNINAIVMIGSQARMTNSADQYSDLDIILVVSDVNYFIQSNDWLKRIGNYHISFIEDTVGGYKERRILFDNSRDVDFIFLPEKCIQTKFESNEVNSVFTRGYKVLFDQIGFSDILTQMVIKDNLYLPLAENEYQNIVNNFWYHSVWTYKKLQRGEIWVAKSCLDCYMKELLLRFIEHYAHITNGYHYDTWHNGRFLEKWSEPWIVEKLPEVFSTYYSKDIFRALAATMDLFRLLAIKIAKKLHYEYPEGVDKYATNWIARSANLEKTNLNGCEKYDERRDLARL